MIQVDDRAGSAQVAPLLKGLGVTASLTRLGYGDVAFLGNGPDGIPVNVGVEIKSPSDLISCIQSGRFAGHQLPGMIACYDHLYLLIVGEWRARIPDGVLEYRKPGHGGGMYWAEAGGGQRRWMWRDLEAWLMTMRVMGGVQVVAAVSYPMAAQWLKAAYNWYQRPEHKSHLVMYSGKNFASDVALLVKPSLARRVAAELPGIGEKKSALVAARFKSLDEMAGATVREWMGIEGIGKRMAEQIVRAVRGGGGNDAAVAPVRAAKPVRRKAVTRG